VSSFTLSLAGISVTLNSFVSNDYPRISLQPLSAVEFSALGTPAVSGSYFEPKYIWSITAMVDKEKRNLIDAIAYEFQARRRALEECDILVIDKTAPVTERNPRSRAIAPGTIQTLLGDSHVVYFAQFKAALTEPIKFSKLGILDSVSFSLVETVRVNP